MPSLSLRPWTRDSTEDASLQDILPRANLERGHFRNITEASLKAEIAGDGVLESSESEEDEDEEQEDVGQPTGKPNTVADLLQARNEMVQHVGAAHNDAMMALDFISLVLSKDAPQANTTISQNLRQEVQPGTLGTDIWQRMPEDTGRQAQDELIATNVRMESLQDSADGLLAAANRLQENVRMETRYWSQVLSISEKGWNVCRIPGQRHKLGVTFGFSESASEFSRKGVAALNASEDGSIVLERGIGSKPRAMRVLLRRYDKTIGASKLPAFLDDEETTLESRIRHARDSMYDEELYHEIIREARTLKSLGVSMRRNEITFNPKVEYGINVPEVAFELVTLDEVMTPSSSVSSGDEDSLAQAIALGARMLLTHAHRDRLKKRSEVPAPMSGSGKEERPMLPILRPIMSLILHHRALLQTKKYFARLKSLFSTAGIDTTICEPLFKFSGDEDPKSTTAESLVENLLQPWKSDGSIVIEHVLITPISIKLQLETTLSRNYGTLFTLTSPNQHTFTFDSLDDLQSAADHALSLALAKGLTEIGGEEWSCDSQTAIIAREEGPSRANQSCQVWITVDSVAGVIVMGSSPDKKITWHIDDPKETGAGLWNAWEDIL